MYPDIDEVVIISLVDGKPVQIARNPNTGTIIHCNGVKNSEYAGIFTIFLKYLLCIKTNNAAKNTKIKLYTLII